MLDKLRKAWKIFSDLDTIRSLPEWGKVLSGIGSISGSIAWSIYAWLESIPGPWLVLGALVVASVVVIVVPKLLVALGTPTKDQTETRELSFKLFFRGGSLLMNDPINAPDYWAREGACRIFLKEAEALHQELRYLREWALNNSGTEESTKLQMPLSSKWIMDGSGIMGNLGRFRCIYAHHMDQLAGFEDLKESLAGFPSDTQSLAVLDRLEFHRKELKRAIEKASGEASKKAREVVLRN